MFNDTAIVDHRFSFADRGKQTSVFIVPVCSKQTDFCRWPFSVFKKQTEVGDFHLRNSGNVETWTWIHGDMEKWSHGDGGKETWKYGNMETWLHGDMVTLTSRHQTENTQAIFLNPFTVCFSCKRKFVICPFVEAVCKRTKWTKRTKRTKQTLTGAEMIAQQAGIAWI